jgi:hypothetical protein
VPLASDHTNSRLARSTIVLAALVGIGSGAWPQAQVITFSAECGPAGCSLLHRSSLLLKGEVVMAATRSRYACREHGAPAVGVVLGTAILLSLGATENPPLRLGDPLPGISPAELQLFNDGKTEFLHTETAADGLGPVFNNTSCGACHSGPATGGDSAIVETRFGLTNPDGSFDPLVNLGGSLIQVHGTGPIAPQCFGETVPPQANTVALRKTTPLFGLGLIDNVPDQTLLALASSEAPGVAGRASSVTDVASGLPRIGRFGWKAQNATLKTFSGDAYLNEMGITNPLFPAENAPQGRTDLILPCDGKPTEPAVLEDDGTDLQKFTNFMSLLAPPPRGTINPPVQQGEAIFDQIGCSGCHVADLTTGTGSTFPELNNVTFHPYSDLLLHDMGTLNDGIAQANASGHEMRTAPLWGLSARRTFLHDGKSTNLNDAIARHDGQGKAASDAFSQLSQSDQQRVIKFLNSL